MPDFIQFTEKCDQLLLLWSEASARKRTLPDVAESTGYRIDTIKDHRSRNPPGANALQSYTKFLNEVFEDAGLSAVSDARAAELWSGSLIEFKRALLTSGDFARMLTEGEADLRAGVRRTAHQLREMLVLPCFDDPYREDTALTVPKADDDEDHETIPRWEPQTTFRLRLDKISQNPSRIHVLVRRDGLWTVWNFDSRRFYAEPRIGKGTVFWPKQDGDRAYYAAEDGNFVGEYLFLAFQTPRRHRLLPVLEAAAATETALDLVALNEHAAWFLEAPESQRRWWRGVAAIG